MQSSATIGELDVEQEYLTVRNKVQGRIKQLEGRLSPAPSHQNSHITTPRVCHTPNRCCHSHSCHHHSHNYLRQMGHSPCMQHHQPSQFNTHNQHSKSQQVSNDLIGEALLQSIKGQQIIQENIQALANRVELLSVQHPQQQFSRISEASSSATKRIKTPLFKEFNLEPTKEREEEYLLPVPVDEKTPVRKNQLKRVKSAKVKVKGDKSKSKIGSSKKNVNKSKSKKHGESDYYITRECPIHSPQKLWPGVRASGQIYKDSRHRNRKHEKDHLLSSFEQQSRSRKRLISKLDKKVFQEYGIK